MTDEERMDDLLALAEAHSSVLSTLVRHVLPNPQSRAAAREKSCAAFELLYSNVEMTERLDRLAQKAMAEIELIFRDPSAAPQADQTGG